MNLNEKGWFHKYLGIRTRINKPESEAPTELAGNKDFSLYRSIQPTGLMYGHPVIPDYLPKEQLPDASVQERMKVVLIESLLHSAQREVQLQTESDYEDFSYEFAKDLIEYYLQTFPELAGSSYTIWGKQKSKELIAEELLEKRLKVKGSLIENLWVSFFHNSLLFLDVFYFRLWMDEKDTIKTVDSLRKEKQNLRLSLLKVIAAAANADDEIQKEERKLFNMFLKSADLDAELAADARKMIDDKLTVDDVDIPTVDSWILKKYFLELAILAVWADQVVAEEEREFINKLSKKLGFSEEETESSMVAIESFVLSHWDEMGFFLKNKDYAIVGKLFMKQMGKVATKNKDRIATEIKESKELMELMTASVNRELTPDEKEKVRAQLVDILKMLPTFVIIALPGTFLTLPILLKILPKSALPSAFQE